MSFVHVMLDLETMGVGPNAAITAIGAVGFSGTTIFNEFYRKVDLVSSVADGGAIDANTVLWWMRQSKEAQQATFSGGTVSVQDALRDFSTWYSEQGTDTPLWGNGSDFDNVILKSAYERVGMKVPWSPFKNRCFRTIKNEFPNVQVPGRTTTLHNALEDAKYQALWLQRIWGVVRRDAGTGEVAVCGPAQ